MRSHNPYSFSFPLLLILACQAGDAPAPDSGSPTPLAGTPIPLTRFGADSFAFAFYTGLRIPANLVVRDAGAWAQLWQNVHALVTPVPPLPAVDFTQEMIVASALGTRNSGGYNVLLGEAVENESGVQVQVVETSPGDDCVTSAALTQPVDLATMPFRAGPVEFVVTKQVKRCGH